MKLSGKYPDRYKQDEDGQWWYFFAKKSWLRVYPKVCDYCGEEYVPAYRGKRQQTACCSRSCGIKKSHAENPGRLAGEKSGRWKGGKTMRRGYVMVLAPDHHSIKGKTRRYVLEHRIVMEKKLGRNLEPHEQVHHINGIKDDNRPENLELWSVSQPPGQRVTEKPHCKTCTCHSK